MSDARHIATVSKNTREEVRVSLSRFNGHELVDVRTFLAFDDGDGQMVPTKKGISLKVERLRELIEALQAAEAVSRGRCQ